MRLRSRHGVMLVAALAVLSFNLSLPMGWTESTPLPWDEAGHYLGVLNVHDGIVHGDAGAMRRALLGADQYPPGHSLVLGSWIALFGNHVASWLSFGLVVYVLTAVLLAQLHVAAGLFFIGFGMFGGLAPSLMVEPLAVLWVVLALRLMPPGVDTRIQWARLVAAWLMVGCALMTKYNFGLPLVVALVVASVVRRDRRLVAASLLGAITVLAGWATFLGAQDQGWEMFRSFARNRANSVGFSPFDRLAWYLRSFRGAWLGSSLAGVALLATFVAATLGGRKRWREPQFAGAAALIAATLGAIAMHPYLLGRNLVVVIAGLAVLLGAGLGSIASDRRRAPVHVAVILIALLSIPVGNASRTRLVDGYFPESARQLDGVSDVVVDALSGGGFVRVVGTFNAFGSGWVRLLQMQHAPETSLSIDAPYPLDRSREGLDPGWDPAYEKIVEGWASDGTRCVVGLEPMREGPFFAGGYERWGQWKLNLIRALEESESFACVRSDSLDSGVRVVVFENNSGGGDPRQELIVTAR